MPKHTKEGSESMQSIVLYHRCQLVDWEFDSRALARHSEWLADSLEEHDVAISELARRSGFDKAYLSKYVNGHYENVTIKTVARMDKAFSDIVSDNEKP